MLNIKDLIPEVKDYYSPKDQLDRVLDELCELEQDIISENNECALEECVDVIHTSFNLLYKMGYDSEKIMNKINFVVNKNRKRGYYK